MNAHIRLVSSETVAEDANIHDAHENTRGGDEAPIGLPEEGGSNRTDVLGEAPPPLVSGPEDRAVRDAKTGSKKGVSKLVALIWPSKAKTPVPVQGEANEGEGEGERKEEATASAAEASQGPGGEAEKAEEAAVTAGDRPVVDDSQARDGVAVAAAAKAKRRVLTRKGALAAALAASVAIPAIVVLNWPRSAPQPVVEPGMLADGQTKMMAPSAALATAPPREALNVSRDRPLVNETRRDEFTEMLSFKGGDKAADGATPKAAASATILSENTAQSPKAEPPSAAAAPAAQPQVVAQAPETASPPPAHPASERAAVPPADPEAKSADAAQMPASHLVTPLSVAPKPSAVAPAPSEPGLGEAAKIEARLADLETALKDRSNEAHVRLEAEKAETHTLEKIAELGALVTRLTGQVKDLQDKVQTLSTSAEEKFADLTRRVALGEANRAVASAENAGSAGSASPPQDAPAPEERARMKVAAADVKRNYRIQAASPGLAMLTAVDGSPDDRPLEVAIGTELPGYGKV